MIIEITSKNNNHIKYLKKVMCSSRFRKEEKKFIAEGHKICEEVVKNDIPVKKIFYTRKFYEKFHTLVDEIINLNSPQVYVVNEEIIKSVSDTVTPQGVMCLCDIVDKNINLTKIDKYQRIILLEDIQNPSNMGSIIRTADALGIDLIGAVSKSCDIYNPKVLRGAMGSVFRMNFVVIDSMCEFINFLKKKDFQVFATYVEGNCISLNEKIFKNKIAVVLGNEGSGVTQETLQACNYKLTIPMNPKCESLNVSVAAGIIMWEMINRGKSFYG